jgi:hypothetical protein
MILVWLWAKQWWHSGFEGQLAIFNHQGSKKLFFGTAKF